MVNATIVALLRDAVRKTGQVHSITSRAPVWLIVASQRFRRQSSGFASCAPGLAHAMSACTNPIIACPCAIKSAGDYSISGPGLIAAPPGDCIHVDDIGQIGDIRRDVVVAMYAG